MHKMLRKKSTNTSRKRLTVVQNIKRTIRISKRNEKFTKVVIKQLGLGHTVLATGDREQFDQLL